MHLDKFRELPIIGILRGIRSDQINLVADAVAEAGLGALEITMNTQSAPALIKAMKQASGNRFCIGAGTVISMDHLDAAISAGAEFIVMPVVEKNIIGACIKQGLPVFPGALTPTEVFTAWKLGAAMVKIFPYSPIGTHYLKELKGPFNQIELLACGGVTPLTVAGIFNSGASGAAFGAGIFRPELLNKPGIGQVTEEIRAIITAFRDWKRNSQLKK